MKKLKIDQLDLKNKKALMRVDFNVPQSKQGEITDDTRIKVSIPSILYALDQGAALILLAHSGRPDGKPNKEFSLGPCAQRLSELIKRPVMLAPDCIGPDVQILAKNLKAGEVLLLENLRFHAGEEHPEKDPSFVKELASLGDVYINDAFGSAHRAHASTAELAKLFPGKAAAGFLMDQEINFLGNTLINPRRPFYAIIGGSKISSKIGVIKALANKADGLLIGGGMAYTFFKAQGIPIGNSIHEDKFLNEAKAVIEHCNKNKIILILPTDNVVVKTMEKGEKPLIAERGIPEGFQGVDIGPKTIEAFKITLSNAGTVFWNGPLGVFEDERFAAGTKAVATILANINATTIVGGGDSIAALNSSGLSDRMTHLSTGGGASLEFIEFGTLPGIEALSNDT